MTSEQKALCAAWVASPNRKWQTLNRAQWKYQFREKTLVRYVEEAKMDEDFVPLLLEYLTSDDCKATLQLYGQGVSSDWTPTRAWYEISNKSAGNVRAVRLYHAVAIQPADGTDDNDGNMYVVQDGCAYRVGFTYFWKRESVVDVATAYPSTSGVQYQIVNLQRDPETGLFNYAVEKRERVRQDIEEYLMKTTQFEDVSEEVHLGVRGDLDAGGKQASVSNGKVVTRKVTKNQDCTHDVHNTITQDKAVPEAEVAVQVGLRGTSVTTVNRNMPAPASTEGLAPGESVRNQKTDSKLWNQTIRRYLRDALVWLRGTCRKTIFAHSHSETTNVKENPGFDHVVEAAGGVIHEMSVHKTEEGYDVTDGTLREVPVRDASVTKRMTLNGLSVQRLHRNQPEPLPDPTEVGRGVTNRKTDGGLYDITETEEGAEPAGKTGESCSHDAFTHHHAVTVNEAEPQDVETEFAPGKIVRKTATLTGNGTANNGTDTTTAVPQVNRYNWTDERGTHYVVKYRNQPEPINEAPPDADVVTPNDSMNSFGLHDGQCTWSFLNGKWKVSANDFKFNKQTTVQKYYDVLYSKRTRVWYHREWDVSVHHVRGSAYTEYIDELGRVNPTREASGILGLRLVEKYSDSHGNLLCEYVKVTLEQVSGGYVRCDVGRNSRCEKNHGWEKHTWNADCRFIIDGLLKNG